MEWSKANRKPNTAKRHRTSMASLVHFFRDQRINTIRPGHLENYKTWRVDCQIKPVSIRHDLHAASQLFQFAQKQGWCESNPVKLVEMPSDRKSRNDRILSVEEEQKYLAAAANNDSLCDFAPALCSNRGSSPAGTPGASEEFTSILRSVSCALSTARPPHQPGRFNLTSESCVILGRRMAGSSSWVFPSRRKVWRLRRRTFYWVTIDDKHLTYSGICQRTREGVSQIGGCVWNLLSPDTPSLLASIGQPRISSRCVASWVTRTSRRYSATSTSIRTIFEPQWRSSNGVVQTCFKKR